jgi:hypothetical protein
LHFARHRHASDSRRRSHRGALSRVGGRARLRPSRGRTRWLALGVVTCHGSGGASPYPSRGGKHAVLSLGSSRDTARAEPRPTRAGEKHAVLFLGSSRDTARAEPRPTGSLAQRARIAAAAFLSRKICLAENSESLSSQDRPTALLIIQVKRHGRAAVGSNQDRVTDLDIDLRH